MKQWLTDPIILICSGIILVGIFGLFWAVGKFRQAGASVPAAGPPDELGLPGPDLRDLDFRAPPLTSSIPVGSSPAVSRDVAARLDSMTQRLTEMQTVLMKQSGAAVPGAGSGAAGGVGQGFSPETIDKLLKIIGNVIQQVDILQKSMTASKDV